MCIRDSQRGAELRRTHLQRFVTIYSNIQNTKHSVTKISCLMQRNIIVCSTTSTDCYLLLPSLLCNIKAHSVQWHKITILGNNGHYYCDRGNYIRLYNVRSVSYTHLLNIYIIFILYFEYGRNELMLFNSCLLYTSRCV